MASRRAAWVHGRAPASGTEPGWCRTPWRGDATAEMVIGDSMAAPVGTYRSDRAFLRCPLGQTSTSATAEKTLFPNRAYGEAVRSEGWRDLPADVDRLSEAFAGHFTSMEAVCALSAALSLRTRSLHAPSAVEKALSDVLDRLGFKELGASPSSRELQELATVLRGRVAEACELSADPAREPAWRPTVRDVIEGQALGSEALGRVVSRSLLPQLPGLDARLCSRGASFLDVGVGGAGLVITLCRRWATLVGTGIDVWEPALRLARDRVTRAGLDGRVELRRQDVRDLEDCELYDLTWIPVSFLSGDALPAAVTGAWRASRPGAWIILSLTRGRDPLADALARLRAVRAGGSAISSAQAESLLHAEGCDHVQSVDLEEAPSVTLVAGRRPGKFMPGTIGAGAHPRTISR
jgi:Methyltransferase domain